ncbi:MAG: thioredoxin family protein [Candidatus Marinimicrobia bacterium]|nr:thioredoxin family protein [Candidatus Neomarinimicrobiota bacterium]
MKTHFFAIIAVLFLFLVSCSKKSDQEITWEHNIDIAVEKSQKKPVMIDFMAEWCPPCQEMEKTTFNNSKIIKKADKFVTVRIDVDKQETVAQKYNGNASKYGGVGIPNILFLNSDGKKLRHIIGYRNAEQLAAVMDSVLTGKYKPSSIE